MEHIGDSIDDLISLLNCQKQQVKPSSSEERIIQKVDHDIDEIGNLLNETYNTLQNKVFLPSRVLAPQTQKIENKAFNSTMRTNEKSNLKSELISRNFLNKTTSYGVSSTAPTGPRGIEADQEEVDLTFHPKVSTYNAPTRYMIFQPILEEMKRPTTPPDHGYYFKFANNDVKLIKYLLEGNGFRETNNNYNFSIFWSCGAIKNEVYQSLGYYQKVNHFPRSQEITRKDHMHRNISRMQTTFGLKNFNFIPKSYILPMETPLLENDFEKNKGQWYIVKPQASSQGRGIFLTNKLDEITAKQNSNIIVSHYINDPYLINGLKFDLRVYVAVTSIHPLRIYIYKEGLVRFATVPYDTEGESYNNRFVHLTNYSINKKSETYVDNDENEDAESASKWSFATFKTYLQTQGIDFNGIFSRIEDLVIKTILSIESVQFAANVSQVPHRHNCFELLGFDILLDSKLKPWLLEVNLSPSLACESSLDLKIKSELMSDLFNMAGVVPLDQRTYVEPLQLGRNQAMHSYGTALSSFDKKSSGYSEVKPIESLTKEEKAVIRETNEEFERRGQFKRIFPAANVNDYKNYFEVDRPYNKLLRTVINNNLKKDNKKVDHMRAAFQNPKKLG